MRLTRRSFAGWFTGTLAWILGRGPDPKIVEWPEIGHASRVRIYDQDGRLLIDSPGENVTLDRDPGTITWTLPIAGKDQEPYGTIETFEK